MNSLYGCLGKTSSDWGQTSHYNTMHLNAWWWSQQTARWKHVSKPDINILGSLEIPMCHWHISPCQTATAVTRTDGAPQIRWLLGLLHPLISQVYFMTWYCGRNGESPTARPQPCLCGHSIIASRRMMAGSRSRSACCPLFFHNLSHERNLRHRRLKLL